MNDRAAIFIIHSEKHRAPADRNGCDGSFPERWLAECTDELQSTKCAFLAFEPKVSKSCYGGAIVMAELPVIMACIVLQFDFTPGYERVGSASCWRRPAALQRRAGHIRSRKGAPHPMDHYTCRVILRGKPKSFPRRGCVVALNELNPHIFLYAGRRCQPERLPHGREKPCRRPRSS